MSGQPVGERLPDLLVIGAMRSGTTSLYRYLGDHPDIFMVPKELQFFTEHFDRGAAWYRNQFAAGSDAVVWGEATADYLARRSAMTRIAETLPEARMVASLRNPTDRTWSHYGLLKERGKEMRPFADAIDAELAAIEKDGPEADGVFYLAHSMYDIHLERLFSLLDRDRCFVSIFERMVADPVVTYGAMCRFLGVDDAFVPERLGQSVNAYVTFRSLWFRELGRRLPGSLENLIARVNTDRKAVAPAMDGATRERLDGFFAPRIDTVRSLLGDAIPEWN